MAHNIQGISLAHFEEPIREALNQYSYMADQRVIFDVETAARLELTPEKPNSARSVSSVQHEGEADIAQLYVIAFAPGDGSGHPSTRKEYVPGLGWFHKEDPIAPRAKDGIQAEAHLTLATQLIDQPSSDPKLYAGSLSILGLVDSKLMTIGTAGQSERVFADALLGDDITSSPSATYTTKHGQPGERFGDPHAIYNSLGGTLQVCAFLAISSQVSSRHINALRLLGAQDPAWPKPVMDRIYNELTGNPKTHLRGQENAAMAQQVRYMSSTESARYLGCSLASIRRWTDDGLIPHMRTPSNMRRIAVSDLDAFIQQQKRS